MSDDTEQWLTGLEDGRADARDATELRAIGTALIDIDNAEKVLVDVVDRARAAGRSWTEIANVLGGSRQAARQRFGSLVHN